MTNILKNLFGILIGLFKIFAGGYVLYYLFMNITNPTEYDLSKIQWFFYFFIWDIWVEVQASKFDTGENNDNN
jgi:hypothetical protein